MRGKVLTGCLGMAASLGALPIVVNSLLKNHDAINIGGACFIGLVIATTGYKSVHLLRGARQLVKFLRYQEHISGAPIT